MKYKLTYLIILIIGITNSAINQGLASSDMIGLVGAPRLTIEPAQFLAGKTQMKDFIREEMQYPEEAMEQGIQGTVVLSFNINPDGSTNQPRVDPYIPYLNKEAIRIFRKMLWQPAFNMGRPIATRFELPIKFHIKKYKKLCKKRGFTKPEYVYLPIDESATIYEQEEVNNSPYPLFNKQNISFGKFIAENIQYPEAAFKQNIAGTVTLSFIVEPDGRSTHLIPIVSVGGGCVQEAIRLIRLIKWHPGVLDEKAVRTRMQLDITFRLEDSSNKGYSPNNQQNSI